MRSGAETVDEYIDELQGEYREAVQKLRSIILKHAPDIEETMEYGMATFRFGEGKYDFVAISSQKQHLSFYVNPKILDRRKLKFASFSMGKSCFRFKKVSQFNKDYLDNLLKESLKK